MPTSWSYSNKILSFLAYWEERELKSEPMVMKIGILKFISTLIFDCKEIFLN